MDGRGRWLDNVFIERLSRSVKYEEVYIKAYETLPDARKELSLDGTLREAAASLKSFRPKGEGARGERGDSG